MSKVYRIDDYLVCTISNCLELLKFNNPNFKDLFTEKDVIRIALTNYYEYLSNLAINNLEDK